MLKAKDQKILDLLLSGLTISEVARKANVSRSTVYEKLKDEQFLNAYSEELEERKKLARVRSMALTESAYKVLEHTLNNPLGVKKSELIRAAEIALQRLK